MAFYPDMDEYIRLVRLESGMDPNLPAKTPTMALGPKGAPPQYTGPNQFMRSGPPAGVPALRTPTIPQGPPSIGGKPPIEAQFRTITPKQIGYTPTTPKGLPPLGTYKGEGLTPPGQGSAGKIASKLALPKSTFGLTSPLTIAPIAASITKAGYESGALDKSMPINTKVAQNWGDVSKPQSTMNISYTSPFTGKPIANIIQESQVEPKFPQGKGHMTFDQAPKETPKPTTALPPGRTDVSYGMVGPTPELKDVPTQRDELYKRLLRNQDEAKALSMIAGSGYENQYSGPAERRGAQAKIAALSEANRELGGALGIESTYAPAMTEQARQGAMFPAALQKMGAETELTKGQAALAEEQAAGYQQHLYNEYTKAAKEVSDKGTPEQAAMLDAWKKAIEAGNTDAANQIARQYAIQYKFKLPNAAVPTEG